MWIHQTVTGLKQWNSARKHNKESFFIAVDAKKSVQSNVTCKERPLKRMWRKCQLGICGFNNHLLPSRGVYEVLMLIFNGINQYSRVSQMQRKANYNMQ